MRHTTGVVRGGEGCGTVTVTVLNVAPVVDGGADRTVLPGATLQPFAIDTETLPDLDGPADPWRALLGPPLQQALSQAGGPLPALVAAGLLRAA